jgi:GMP synthase (glutamine-hydrolysing)
MTASLTQTEPHPPILVLRHVPHEGLGILADVFATRQLTCVFEDMFASRTDFEPDFSAVSGLVVMGGPMNVDQTKRFPRLAEEVSWIQNAIEAEVPVLGVCLGSQLIAKALGSKVFAGQTKEIGWYSTDVTKDGRTDRMFQHCPPQSTVFQWHGDTFDLPSGATLLASSERYPHQAFRFGKSVYALQFHMEVTTEMICEWLAVEENQQELAGLPYIDPQEIARRTPEELPGMLALAETFFGEFADLCRERV